MDHVLWLVGGVVLAREYSVDLLKGREDTPRILLQNIHNHVPDYLAFKPRPSMNSLHFKNLTSCTKEYKEQVKRGWKGHIGKTELLEAQYFLKTQHLIPHSFSSNSVHCS
jgi:hypothetical protein